MGARTSSSSSLLITTVSILIFAISCFRSSDACGISVYWGQNGNEGSLRQACDSGYYTYVNVAFLITFGSGSSPAMNLAGHCDPPSGTCRRFSQEISYCQSVGVKVLLSLGGGGGGGTWYNISSSADANDVAEYLWDNFLAGGNPNGFLGDVALDGIDFDIEVPVSTSNWDVLARAIAAYSTPERKIYLAAAPQCIRPDRNLDTAIRTGLFDYVWVQFYNNPPCDIRSGVSGLLQSWNEWSSSLPAGNQLFMGLPAAPAAAGGGYVPPQQLINDILPVIRQSTNYGGIMLWSRFYDTSYSQTVSPYVCSGVSGEIPHISMVAEN